MRCLTQQVLPMLLQDAKGGVCGAANHAGVRKQRFCTAPALTAAGLPKQAGLHWNSLYLTAS